MLAFRPKTRNLRVSGDARAAISRLFARKALGPTMHGAVDAALAQMK